MPVDPGIWPNDAHRADVLVTRHWICHVLWDLGNRHGFLSEQSLVAHMRPDYALTIARDSIETCESFNMTCLEYHGVGLVRLILCIPQKKEKLYDIVASAEKVAQTYKAATSLQDPSLDLVATDDATQSSSRRARAQENDGNSCWDGSVSPTSTTFLTISQIDSSPCSPRSAVVNTRS